ncbi:MAG: 3-oxoacyl-ACP reductase FabG [Armatimonadetes bacterium]|nr:3-oxoacyl-ACP reductase FabG [Armatimonadota bacterium]
MSLEWKVALVTGASRGIGRAIALQLAQDGATVACAATKAENAQGTVEAILSGGGKAHAFGVNVGDLSSVDQLVKDVASSVGEPSIVVNNAGITRDGLLMRMSDEDWNAVIQTNLSSIFYLARALTRPMMKARWGRVINVSSVIGIHGGAGQANYAAAKSGIIGFSKSLAKELGPRNITCNVVAPGFIETDMTADLTEDMRAFCVDKCPLGRLGAPEDIAGVVSFLTSDSASFITGQVIEVDGGLFL